MLSNWELWACANHDVARHGVNAAVMAAFRSDELFVVEDHDGVQTYRAIVERIQWLGGSAGPLH